MNYDAWKLATPPEYEHDARDGGDAEEVCDECLTVQLSDFVHATDVPCMRRRCEACSAVDEVGF